MESFTIKSEKSFESQVYFFINSKCDKEKGECVFQEYSSNKSRFRYDLYLPKGCKALKIKSKTAIELKLRITYNSIERCTSIYKMTKEDINVNHFFVIYYSIQDYFEKSSKHLKANSIQFYQFEYYKTLFINEENSLQYLNLTWKEEQEIAINKANKLFYSGKNTFFLGAGVSSSAGLPSWDKLLQSMIKQSSQCDNSEDYSNNLNKDSDNSSIIKGRYIKMLYNNDDNNFVTSIKNALNVSANNSLLIRNIGNAIKTKRINQIITYNYDDLIENELDLSGINFTSISKSERLIGDSLPIYHVHGYIPIIRKNRKYNPNDVRLSEDSYHEIYKDSYHWSNVIQLYALNNSTCFFIGLSMKDPNLRRLLDISTKRGDESIYHFAFLKRDEFTQHKLTENIFREMEVQIIWFEEFNELPHLINRIFQ